ncbi:MAG: UDP-glucose 4-epimerase GalE [Candidatus Alcyoniella australis]|nr:UDP-glucose 4-epimerase GalE [Candidatus Alcyoniella australis]
MSSTILVAGGAGYIGSVTAQLLIDAGHRVLVVDDLSRGHRAAVPQGAELTCARVGDVQAISELLRSNRVDSVFHFCAHSLVGESMRDPALYYENNLIQGKLLLDAMIAADVKHMIFSSTCAIFGLPQSVPILEDDPMRPANPYGETKYAFERMLHWYHEVYGLNYTALRYFNACGATATHGEHHDPETHLIPLVLFTAMGKREQIEIYGTDYETRDGTCVRDYIHVLDLAAAHLTAFEQCRDRVAYYNLGNGAGFTVREVIDAARRVTGRPIQVHEGPRRAGDPPVLVGGTEKINRELGWSPEHTELDQIIESAWRWHSAHPDGYPG